MKRKVVILRLMRESFLTLNKKEMSSSDLNRDICYAIKSCLSNYQGLPSIIVYCGRRKSRVILVRLTKDDYY